MSEKNPFKIPGISDEAMEKARAEGSEVNQINEEKMKEGTGVKGKTLSDAINLGKIKEKTAEIEATLNKPK